MSYNQNENAAVSDLKTEVKIVNYKIDRIEATVDGMKTVLEKLTDIYHNQSIFQEKLIHLYEEQSAIKNVIESRRTETDPIILDGVRMMSNAKLAAKWIGSILGIVQVCIIYAISFQIDTISDIRTQFEEVRSKLQHTTQVLDQHI